ncbi:uncharacterized protein YjbI with pentapeptide repeats [Actinocorallia herbida]|uniref:Uncharacterized protein YjbI with pentapeptide repeats n=1 Tax=Actinocorallia herbida TaxID=58109 RepID=A0A3N1DD52_9ACTN|nr:pentapeptide repeat-containing protein [Actinocorallia herbida]ROO91078.1 uncharacterized protein YjbI with pentapeptide repeats [Actinocorallia herbida]
MELHPGGNLDLRGTTVDAATWDAVRAAATGPDGVVRLGRCRLDDARLDCADFHGVVFEGDVSFDRAEFRRGTAFRDAVFTGNAGFHEAVFHRGVSFDHAVFLRHAGFTGTRFNGDALFTCVRWHTDVAFTGAWFVGAADLDRASCARDVQAQETRFSSPISWRHGSVERHLLLDRAAFRDCAWLGPLTVGGRISLNSARASRTLRLTATAPQVSIRNAMLHATTLRTPADLSHTTATELHLQGDGPLTLTGTVADAARLTGVDLGACLFESAELAELALRDCRFPGRLAEEPAAWTADLYRRLAEATDDPEQAREFRYRAVEIYRKSHPSPWWRFLLAVCRVTSGYGHDPVRMHVTLAVLLVACLLMAGLGIEEGTGLVHLAHP